MIQVIHTTTGNYRSKRVGLETKRHPESGNSLSAYHHLRAGQMMDLPESTQPPERRHLVLWTAAWWRFAPEIEIEAAQIIHDEAYRLSTAPDEPGTGAA